MEFKDATAMSQAIREKRISSRELVEDTIQTIEKLNPLYNAVVSKQYETALAEADNLDRHGGEDKPFLGVPLLLKDLGQNESGQPSTSGSRLFKASIASQTDYFVQALKNMGFLILGRTNTPEFGFKNISDSSLHGPVRLPLDRTRNAGGSSGGAAAALASGMVPIAAASDGGGSIRIPASFNGLIGLKPSRGRVPVGPSSYRGWQGASSNFALTKSIRDTKRLLFHLQTYQVEAPFPLAPLVKDSLFCPMTKPIKIAFSLQSPIGTLVSNDAKNAVIQLLPQLEALGYEVEELKTPILDGIEVMKAYYLMNSVETAQMFDDIEAFIGRPMMVEDMEPMTWAIYQSGQTIPAKLYSKVLQDWDQYSAKMATFHESYDLLLTPTVADIAPTLEQFIPSDQMVNRLLHSQELSMSEQQQLIWDMFEDSLAWTPFTQHANITGQPSISLPTYYAKNGLPIGVQLTAAKGREDILLQVAETLEVSKCWEM
ncbi:amidase [Streptococcus suis]|nr:amidase [Streptococcus suis]